MRELDRLRMGELIRRLREHRGLTQRELAQAAGLGESALRSYELGARYPKERQLIAIAKALRVSPEAFEVCGVCTDLQLLHTLFNLEDYFELQPNTDGSLAFRETRSGVLTKGMKDWGAMFQLLQSGEIDERAYFEWKATYSPPVRG